MTAHKTYTRPMPSNTPLYDRDFYAWANQQADHIRARRFQDLDIENLAEEVESMGRSEKKELASRFAVLMAHLLKWKYQPLARSPSWRNTIWEQRRQLRKHLNENPSLKSKMDDEFLADIFTTAKVDAADETGVAFESFPEQLPWTLAELDDDRFFPD